MRKPLTIGLFGFGCVGKGLYDVLNQTRGLSAGIKSICVKDRNKTRPLPMDRFTFDEDELINDPEIDVIVELIDDAEAAFAIVQKAMAQGKAVVSANKKMIADHFIALRNFQKQHQVPFLYEASSCASIPIIRNIEEYYDNDLIRSVEGIFNGSSNYILSALTRSGCSYEEALMEAIAKGYAESDPALDVGGYDAAYKLRIITAHAFGIVIPSRDVLRAGIENITQDDLSYAAEKGCRIKQVAGVIREGSRLNTYVMPRLIPTSHPLYAVDDVFNAVIVEGAFADKQCFIGKGAGAFPTGSAVLSDISALSYQYKYEYRKFGQAGRPVPDEQMILEVYVRYKREEDIRNLDFIAVNEDYRSSGFNYKVGCVDGQQLKRSGILDHPHVFVCHGFQESRCVRRGHLQTSGQRQAQPV